MFLKPIEMVTLHSCIMGNRLLELHIGLIVKNKKLLKYQVQKV